MTMDVYNLLATLPAEQKARFAPVVGAMETRMAAHRAQQEALRAALASLTETLDGTERLLLRLKRVIEDTNGAELEADAGPERGTGGCLVPWCEKALHSPDLCETHYRRKQLYGDPYLRRRPGNHRTFIMEREAGPGQWVRLSDEETALWQRANGEGRQDTRQTARRAVAQQGGQG